jgi:hypothetical protein
MQKLCDHLEKIHTIKKLSLDGFPNKPIIGRNTQRQMNTIFSLSLIIVVLIVVLIIEDLIVVRMAPVREKK